MALLDPKARAKRAQSLGQLNGLRMVTVTVPPAGTPPPLLAEVVAYFFNTNSLAALVADTRALNKKFPIFGGRRVPAGEASDYVQVRSAAAGPTPDSLQFTVSPIGDYSTYTLGIVGTSASPIDPVFAEIEFKFRPGCFSLDCEPDWAPPPPPRREPVIDYLAKDYDSFRHTLITAMQERVPGWVPTSEADLSQVLIDLFAAAADELSDYQDRVMSEAYLLSARKRVSLARHARLMDYHVDEGNQASSWMAFRLVPTALPIDLPGELEVWTGSAPGGPDADPEAALFRFPTPARVNGVVPVESLPHMEPLLNDIDLYTWSDARPALGAGDTRADLGMPDASAASALCTLIQKGRIPWLLIQEHRNPDTGTTAAADVNKRQLLRLLSGADHCQALQDPLTGAWMVRVNWEPRDRLLRDYCFRAHPGVGLPEVDKVSLFHGNLVQVFQGRGVDLVFRPPGERISGPRELHWLPPRSPDPSGQRQRWGALCPLPDDRPLLYRNTERRNEQPSVSTLRIEVEQREWLERESLIHSTATDPHFVVETDELGRSVIRFGNGQNGMALPGTAIVEVSYQSGRGIDGNVGSDQLLQSGYAQPLPPQAAALLECWNPFDVTDGREPEPATRIVRNAPEAYRVRQLRAVTLQDYVDRAQEVPGVQRAAARYAWTGSWRTVRITIDPAGTETLSDELENRVAAALETVRLLGEDLEIRPPSFVPLQIDVAVCLAPGFWAEDVRRDLQQEFSDGYTRDGRPGFFHPDAWTFGQRLHRSQLEGRVLKVPGIEHVVQVSIKRWDATAPGSGEQAEVRPEEIIQVHNDPDHMELGSIAFDLSGGLA